MFFSLWKLGGLSVKELAVRVYNEIWDDELLDSAAQLAYYFLFALFPLLIFLTSIFGFIVSGDNQLQKDLFMYLGTVLPGSALDLVRSVITEVGQSSSGGKLTFGLFLALWAASSGMEALTQSLNKTYEIKESRSWWWRRLVSIFLTIILAILIISALMVVLFGGQITDYVSLHLGFGAFLTVVWQIVQYLIVLAFVLLAFALIYYISPDVKEQKFAFITPGAIVGIAIWLLVSLGFRLYLSYFNSYSATYGSLGAVIILMLWLYFTGAAILIGGEINSEIENALAEAGAPEAKERGEKSPDDGKPETADQNNKRTSPASSSDNEQTSEQQKAIPRTSTVSDATGTSKKNVLSVEVQPVPGRSSIFTKIFAAASMLTGVVRSFRNK